MTLIDFLTYIALPLSAGPILDGILAATAKTAFSRKIAKFARPTATKFDGGAGWIDAKLGAKLFSRKALIWYISISLGSFWISYLFAAFTTQQDLVSTAIFSKDPTTLDIAMFLVCLLGSVGGDILSYGQSRIFLRAIDKYRNGIVSLGLIIADGAVSLTLFLITFSFSRLIVYYLILVNLAVGENTSFTIYLTDAAKEIVEKSFPISAEAKSLSPSLLFLDNISAAQASKDEAKAVMAAKQYDKARNLFLPNNVKTDFMFTCYSPQNVRQFLILTDTETLIKQISDERSLATGETVIDRQKKLIEYVNSSKNSNNRCAFPVAMRIDSISPTNLLANEGFLNAFFASLERNIYDSYLVFAYKLSNYAPVDPYIDYMDYLRALGAVSQTTFLGVARPNPSAIALLPLANSPPVVRYHYFRVPFSPMISSCLTTTFLFSLYIVIQISIQFRNIVARILARSFSIFSWDNAPFSVIGISIAGLAALFYASSALLSFIWRLLLP